MLNLLADHLWQSTLFGGAAAIVALSLRAAPARLRGAVWLAASLKFLVPFAWLRGLGRSLGTATTVTIDPNGYVAVETLAQPFSSASEVLPPLAPVMREAVSTATPDMPWAMFAVGIWLSGSVWLAARWMWQWHGLCLIARASELAIDQREALLLEAAAAASGVHAIPLHFTEAVLEPGVFGIGRPVLLWPRDIGPRLTDAQVSAILAHELAHVRRRDNLAALLTMVVRAAFWFHPLVVWIERQWLIERERACDEAVLQSGNEREAYAEGLLRTCEFCVESSLLCASGVTGADLKRRVTDIMYSAAISPAARWHRCVVVMCALAAAAGPLCMGLVAAPPPQVIVSTLPPPSHPPDTTQVTIEPARFEVASIKKSADGGTGNVTLFFQPGGRFVATNVTLRMLISAAYGGRAPLQRFQLTGGPAWMDTDRFSITAKAEGDPRPDNGGPAAVMLAMLRTLLADRFNVRVRHEQREGDIYTLTLRRSDAQFGPALRRSDVDCAALMHAGAPPPRPAPGQVPPCGVRLLAGKLSARATRLNDLAVRDLSRIAGRMVIDRTGLDGAFDVDLEWTPDPPAPSTPSADGQALRTPESAISIFTAVQEQLGLKLEPARGPIDYVVIERAEQPTPD